MHLVAFTGAGISTPSGIPDFRSTRNGLWQKDDPMEVASMNVFRSHPQRFYDWLKPLLKASLAATPNAAHTALAKMEAVGLVKSVITQNIDGLHQKAGSRCVIELHGNMEHFSCPRCGNENTDAGRTNSVILTGALPLCENCGAVLKPRITLYQEALPNSAWHKAERETGKADVMIIAGTSLEVVPAAWLPYEAQQKGCKLIIINFSPTPLDAQADVVLHLDASIAIPLIAHQVLND